MASLADEGRHQADGQELWNESWYFDFCSPDGSLGGYLRLGLYPNLRRAWYWACVVGEGRPLVAVRDHDVELPRGDVLEIRSSGLAAGLHCEEPHDHWSAWMEAFAVALDDPGDAYGDERGEQVALGLDLEWEASGPVYDYPGLSRYEQSCHVHGEVLLGAERIAFEGPGQRDHSWGHRDWWTFAWCWLSGRLDDGTAFHASRPEIPGVRYEPGYLLRPGDDMAPVAAFSVREQVLGDHGLPSAVAVSVADLDLSLHPLHHAPVKLPAPDGREGRLSRSLCRVEADDGRRGVAWLELNQPPAAQG